MQKIKIYACLVILLTALCTPNMAFSAAPATAETVTLQLKWKHQFQFAGYYAAIEKGYYKAAGLKVKLKEGRPKLNITDELLTGNANYGTDMPNILLERGRGKPIVVLAAIFQHSPEALFTLKGSEINTPHDLIGKVIMLRPQGDIEIRAMLLSEGINTKQFKVVNHTWNINDLIDGKVDASTGYTTDRPFILLKRGIDYSIMRPISYGIDFYGDCLFTTEKEINDHPQRVKAFLKASLKGWDYAMRHQNEIVNLILQKYSTRLSKEALLYEAQAMQKLMLPKFIEIGHMNPGRWKHIGDTFVKLGMLKPDYSLSGFIYNPTPRPDSTKIMRIVWIMLIVIIVILTGAIALLLFNSKLNREVKKRTAQLSHEKLFTDAVIKSLPGVFYVYEDGERLIRWNENFEKESEFTAAEMLNKHPLDWFQGKEKEKVIEKLQTVFAKGGATMEANITFKKGNVVPYYFTGTILNTNHQKFLIGVGLDLTARRQLEERLRQAQKMESIGRLAGGVAHDFNNVLTTILGYSELLLSDMPPDSPYREHIGVIRSAGEKASALTRQLLAFSRKQILEKKAVNINTIINDFLKILDKMLGESIEVETYLTADNGVIEGDQGQIEQILMNLAVNASDAMPDGGRITIETQNFVLNKEYEGTHIDAKPGAYVMLAVTDCGEGMSRDVIEHIFDPFFTTKERDKGTGLGLSTVYGIVKQHDGQIYVYSEIGKGTTFKIYFPACEKSVEHREDIRNIILAHGGETILVVDDEASIRQLVIDTLTPLGYKCSEASGGKEALELIRHTREDIHLLLTDVVMPDMNGKELAEKICKERPAIQVIFMSGYTENTIAHHGVLDANINYIPKPITPTTLTGKIRSVLDNFCG